MQRRYLIPLLTLVLAGGSALAAAKDAPAPAPATISLTRAIEIAEQHIGGQAVEASLDHGPGGPRYEVDVRKGTREYEVHVDAASGKVIAAAPDLME